MHLKLNFIKNALPLICVFLFFTNCSEKKFKHTNALIKETSPYLLQHAHNPVNWKPWNTETLAEAKKQNKLIVISIGYSSCHWCHVMEEESFENDTVAKIMNNSFTSIKIDREERPDIDQIYMEAVQQMTGNSGWPLNCITLPDGRPVFGGTYFTKTQWLKVLNEMAKLYNENPEKIIAYAEKLTAGIKNAALVKLNTEETAFKKETIDTLINNWKPYLDFKNGGQLKAPKFPMANNLSFLLRYSVQNKNPKLKSYIDTTLTKMAYGGIYDHVGGGFSRYAVDDKWHIPHFEKMLYDNAQLVSLYADAYALTKNENYKNTVTETLNFINRELTTTNGAFYSALDADSENKEGELEEGAFYAWTESELKLLIKEDFNLFKNYYNINSYGKWEKNQYVLIKNSQDEAFAKVNNLNLKDLKTKVITWKKTLLQARQKRKPPRTDDKVQTSWNALMLKGYIDAYKAIGDERYLTAALKNANFLKEKQLRKDGGLYHNFKNNKSTIDGFLIDYATLASAYIALYEVTLDEAWLNTANRLIDYTVTHFFDEKSGMFYFTSDKSTNLIARKMEASDKAIPSSNSIIANAIFKLSHYNASSDYVNLSKQMLKNMNEDLKAAPAGYSNWLHLYLNFSNPYYEVAVSGKNALEKVKRINQHYIPNILIAGATKESNMPLMKNRYNPEETYIYICVNGTCKLPVTAIKEVLKQLTL